LWADIWHIQERVGRKKSEVHRNIGRIFVLASGRFGGGNPLQRNAGVAAETSIQQIKDCWWVGRQRKPEGIPARKSLACEHGRTQVAESSKTNLRKERYQRGAK